MSQIVRPLANEDRPVCGILHARIMTFESALMSKNYFGVLLRRNIPRTSVAISHTTRTDGLCRLRQRCAPSASLSLIAYILHHLHQRIETSGTREVQSAAQNKKRVPVLH